VGIMATAPEFRSERDRLFREAELAGRPFIDIRCGDLHETVQQINPTGTVRFANCYNVMMQAFRSGIDEIISESAAQGANFTIRYWLPR
jgi:hypothetical protein